MIKQLLKQSPRHRTQGYWVEAKKDRRFSKEAWIFVILTILSLVTLTKYVDLTPEVDQEFFFSTEDPDYQADIKISQLFQREDAQIIITASGDIFSENYQSRTMEFTDLLINLNGISDVKSITHGPKTVKDAFEGPLWQRLLVSPNRNATNLIVILEQADLKELIPKIENLIQIFNTEDFQIRISGFPYVIEMIRRALSKDLQVFSSLAFLLFGTVIILIFHSWRLLIGMVITCANACVLTFMATNSLGLKVGILTANLVTIVFVLTLSHLVFLTFNWKNLHRANPSHDQHSSVREAIKITIPASFWCMITTMLGFISLLFVQARPLRELGISGAIGTFIAFFIAYAIYPTFLRLKKLDFDRSDRRIKKYYRSILSIIERYHFLMVILMIVLLGITAPKLKELETDPSLISYFSPKSKISQGLEYIDQHGGSNPLVMVVHDADRKKLNNKKTYKRLWALQESLEQHPAVGTVISLPTLIAEGKRLPLGFFISPETILKALEKAKYGGIARSFITEDRQYGLFLLRMKESERQSHRIETMDQLKKIIESHSFVSYLNGGAYALQGRLSTHIAASLVFGLSRLILIFAVIAFIVSGSIRTALGMMISISLIPICMLGGIGFLKIPLDIISAPAANVAIGMGIDAMIHMVHAFKRLKKTKKYHRKIKPWPQVRGLMWEPIVTSMLIVSFGFGIFFLSSFPPTQRFGGAIVCGTILAAMTALFVFPLLTKKS